MFKVSYRIALIAMILLFGSARLANAQNASFYFGVGTATDSSNHLALDDFGDVGPSMGGPFITFGGDVMVRQAIGFGAEYSFHADQTSYASEAGLNYRPVFYDFNAVFHPVPLHARIVPEFQAGLGGADLRFYETATGCAISGVCTTLNQYVASSNHFQLHFSAGVRIYVTPNIFVRPQVDVHWVNNFGEFGSDWVPQYGAAVGFTFGEH